MEFHLARAKESLEAAGAYETVVAPLIRADRLAPARHGQDGHRSSDVRRRRVGPRHDVPNLYIFDGSIWPTSSGMNPTATIAAMSLRCTERLIDLRREQVVPA